ncbi:MAG TPA: A/G-specific adenine glycosylase [Motilibacteraceae bacterium]|nr:A/G-specific adenine glycosylase [Motilibacteraceae bacterium]
MSRLSADPRTGPEAADVAGVAGATEHPLHGPVLAWYAVAARDLPWRAPGVGGWPVLVSEVMLQQTPVARVEPVWRAWMERWPTPADLAAEPPGEAVRAWGRLGYPRRALRLHQAAVAITERHGGEVPRNHDALRALPGVGTYTAAAVASFAFGQRHAVVDTNVRRVLARAVTGRALGAPTQTAAELRLAEQLVPAEPAVAARWAVAVMELGALVCTARTPACGGCPVRGLCAWQRSGCPPDDGPPRRGQAWAGTDRQVRGLLLAVLRAADAPVPQETLDAVWPADPLQRARALDGLVADGLVEPLDRGRYRLPGTA